MEWMQFSAFLLTSILAARLAMYLKKTKENTYLIGFYAVIAAGLFLVSMEEISWGQMIFKFDAPEIMQSVNKQKELNVHNLPVVQTLFECLRALGGIFGLIGVWLFHNEKIRKISPPFILISWFMFIAVLGSLDVFNSNPAFHSNRLVYFAGTFVEVLELLIALSVLIYVWLNSRLLRKL